MELQAILIIVTSMLGFYSISTSFVRFLWWFWKAFLRSPKNLTDYGSWAIITGSTGGIGRAMACELASKGLNLLLIDRELSALENLSNDIRGKTGYRVKIQHLVLDFLEDQKDDVIKKIEEATEGLDIGLLFNNAGVSYPYPQYLHEVESSTVDNVIAVNLDGLTWMTKAVLPAMLKKKKGCIVNMGSGSAKVPAFPLVALYAATKAYVRDFSKCISLEYQKQGVDVQLQEPHFIYTTLTPWTRSSFFVPSPESHSKVAVRWIGYEHTCIPYWTHCLQQWLQDAAPDKLIAAILHHHILDIQKKMMQG